MTMRENILFGLEYDEDDIYDSRSPMNIAYKRAIGGAGLDRDISILPQGDLTEIGERGINISGENYETLSPRTIDRNTG